MTDFQSPQPAHTPGPWVVYAKDGDEWPGIESPWGSVVVWGYMDQNDDAGVRAETRDEALANARLIAAAPELLKVLEASLLWTDEEHDVAEWRHDARAVIARATGAQA